MSRKCHADQARDRFQQNPLQRIVNMVTILVYNSHVEWIDARKSVALIFAAVSRTVPAVSGELQGFDFGFGTTF